MTPIHPRLWPANLFSLPTRFFNCACIVPYVTWFADCRMLASLHFSLKLQNCGSCSGIGDWRHCFASMFAFSLSSRRSHKSLISEPGIPNLDANPIRIHHIGVLVKATAASFTPLAETLAVFEDSVLLSVWQMLQMPWCAYPLSNGHIRPDFAHAQ